MAKLVYKEGPRKGQEVKVGDVIPDVGIVDYFRPPHKPASSGKVTIKESSDDEHGIEYYVSVIGASWIEREDRN